MGGAVQLPQLRLQLVEIDRGTTRWRPRGKIYVDRQLSLVLQLVGTVPPFSASFVMTSLCSQMFIDAESFMSPV